MLSARRALVLIFLVGLALHILALGYAYTVGDIRSATFQSLLLLVLATYSVPLGTVLGGIFATAQLPTGAEHPLARPVALGLSVLWNLLLLGRTFIFAFGSGLESPAELREYVNAVAAASAFLVTGGLTYFFAKQG